MQPLPKVGCSCAVVLALLGAWVGTGHAAPASPDTIPRVSGTLTMARALALSSQYHAGLRAADLRALAARARVRDQGRSLNPTVAAGLENFGGGLGGDRRESTLELRQTLELGGDRGARGSLAESESQLAAADAALLRRELLTSTADRFIAAWTLQTRLVRLREGEQLTQQAIAAAEERHRAGATPALERMRSEAQALSQAVGRQQTEAELGIARRQLALSWGSREATFDSLASDTLSSPEPIGRVVTHPALGRAAANVALAQSRIRAAEAARVPDITLSGGLRRLEEVRGTGFVAGVELPLPLWNRGNGALSAAEQEYAATLADSSATSQQLEADLTNALDRLQSATGTYDMLRLRVRPARQLLIDDMLRAYRSGRLSYLDLVAEQRNLLETDLAVVEAQASLWRARMALEFLVGGESRLEEKR